MKNSLWHVGLCILFMWGSFFVSRIFPLNQFGIIPRTTQGLVGVIAAPFLHGNLNHIVSNTIALITFIPFFILLEGRNAIEKIVVLVLGTGFLTWCLARPSVHIGASGLVFALYGYLIALGFFQKKILLMAVSIFLISSYGYLIFGISPFQRGISWESHLFGLFSGILLAKYS